MTDKVLVGLESQIRASELAVAYLDGDTGRYDGVLREAFEEYGGLESLFFALAFELAHSYVGDVGRERAADAIEERIGLYRDGIAARDQMLADQAASRARLAAVVAAVAEAVEGDA
ncbi:hypothetical protein RHDE110596_22550 [Prescottella defluvii]|uniref:hypothetical protein n=1 Tax=Prescottella defluvii TaxID=1323361 RepID=UPI0004F37F60|nr:hypothetical protein [Prescottella defluvii]